MVQVEIHNYSLYIEYLFFMFLHERKYSVTKMNVFDSKRGTETCSYENYNSYSINNYYSVIFVILTAIFTKNCNKFHEFKETTTRFSNITTTFLHNSNPHTNHTNHSFSLNILSTTPTHPPRLPPQKFNQPFFHHCHLSPTSPISPLNNAPPPRIPK